MEMRCGDVEGSLDWRRECANESGEDIMGVGRLHPLASLQFEMNVLPVKGEAMKRGIEFGYM